MLESLDFHYDGISSKDMGLLNVRTDSGLFEEKFMPSRSLQTVKVKGNDKSYFQGIERESISLPLTFMLPDGFTQEQIDEIKMWFDKDYYKPFYFDDYPERIIYCMYQGDSTLFHNGCGQGYFSIVLDSNSPFVYSPYQTDSVFIDNIVDGFDYEFINRGHLPLKPEIWIKNNGIPDVKIHNYANSNKFEFTGIGQFETIYIDNENRDIISDLPYTYRYDNFNGEYLEIVRGVNRLKIFGKCEIIFRYRYTFI